MILQRQNARVAVTREQEEEVLALYDQGLYRQAWDRALAVGPLHTWRGDAQVLAGRLVNNLFAPQLSYLLHTRAWRENRSSPEAAYFRALGILSKRGPFGAWRFLERLPLFPEATPKLRGNLLTARVNVLTAFRDFERAGSALVEAEAMEGAESRWLWAQRSGWLQAQDRYHEALEAADQSLALHAWYRPAVQQRAELLSLLARDEEAAGFLNSALAHLESPAVAAQLANLQIELGQHEQALASLERVRAWTPEPEIAGEQWLHGRLSDVAYALGDLPRAAAEAAKVKTPFYERIAERLAAARAPSKSVRLAVPFVRQHHLTCAPATLSAISHFLGNPIDHLGLAEVVCYDGTPPHLERHWLEERGWIVREFRVTWPIVRALLDRGLPLTLATVEMQSAHLQAVVGYDERRGTLFIRDPYERTQSEAIVEHFLARYAATGPRGSVFVRAEERHRLESLELPEVELYDHAYTLEQALQCHDRATAEAATAALAALAPGHRLVREAEWRLAIYDGHRQRQLKAVEALLALHPEYGNWLLARLALLRDLTRRGEYLETLQELVQRKGVDPIFGRVWAEELLLDARQHPAAHRLLLRVLRWRPLEAEALAALARLLWMRQDFAPATGWHRLASCVQERREEFGHAYLLAARHLRLAEEPLALFRERFARFAAQSAAPARLLFWALNSLNRPPEAFAVLEQALARRPDDGDLQLFAADAFARYGEAERAAALLAAAKPRSRPATWLRTAAGLADYRCDLRASLGLWQQVLIEEPLAMDAHGVATRLRAEVEGPTAAREQLYDACRRSPHYGPLWVLAVEWTRSEGAVATETTVRELLALEPENAWAHRELALALSGQRRFDEAARAVAQAEALELNEVANFVVAARVAFEAHRLPEARAAAEAAVRLSVDRSAALEQLLEVCQTFEEKRAAIEFIRAELIRQVVLGDGLLTYRELAYPVLEPEALLAGLREAHAARPDLWHAWVALTQQLADLSQLDEALALAERATELFPLHAQTWLQLGLVYGARLAPAEQVRPLERALLLAPSWGRISRVLAEVHERLGQLDQGERTLERAIAAAPLEAQNHVALAEARWRLGRQEQALANLEHALRLQPAYGYAWNLLREWTPPASSRSVELARTLTETRPGEARSWLILAQCLPGSEIEPRLEALRHAITLAPHYADAYDARAVLLAEAGRFDEALDACAPAAWQPGERPFVLAGRAAWINACRGHLQTAINGMEGIVKTTPDYYWGWSQLADWYSRVGRPGEAREAARQMARLAPNRAEPLGYIADLQSRLGDQEESMATLRRACAVDPTYAYAAFRVFEYEVKQRDLSAAETTLGRLRLHFPGPRAEACAIELRARQGRTAETFDDFRQLCFAPAEAGGAVDQAAETLCAAGHGSRVERICGECLGKPGHTRRSVAGGCAAWWRVTPGAPVGKSSTSIPPRRSAKPPISNISMGSRGGTRCVLCVGSSAARVRPCALCPNFGAWSVTRFSPWIWRGNVPLGSAIGAVATSSAPGC